MSIKLELVTTNYKKALEMLKQDFLETQYTTAQNYITEQLLVKDIAYTSSSDFAGFWYNGRPDEYNRLPEMDGRWLRGFAIQKETDQLIVHYQDDSENHYFYKVVSIKWIGKFNQYDTTDIII